jgi:hypothetical protein
MEWCEIIGLLVVWVLGLYLRAKIYEFRKNMHYNDRWRKKKWKDAKKCLFLP